MRLQSVEFGVSVYRPGEARGGRRIEVLTAEDCELDLDERTGYVLARPHGAELPDGYSPAVVVRVRPLVEPEPLADQALATERPVVPRTPSRRSRKA